MDREQALALLHEMTDGASLLRHARTVEIVMRHHAERRGADVEAWGIAGLLHDADYERWPEEHPQRIVDRLQELGESEIAAAIAAHYTRWDKPYETDMARALVACDELTGFVVACSLVRPQRLHGLAPKGVRKRFKDRRFAAKVERDEIERGLELFGIEFDEQVRCIVDALLPHEEELDLAPQEAS